MLHRKRGATKSTTGVADYFAVLGIDSFLPPELDGNDSDGAEHDGELSGDCEGAVTVNDELSASPSSPNNNSPSSNVNDVVSDTADADGQNHNSHEYERSCSQQTIHTGNLSNVKTPRNSNLSKRLLNMDDEAIPEDTTCENISPSVSNCTPNRKRVKSEEEVLHEQRFQREIVQLALTSSQSSLGGENDWTVVNDAALPLHKSSIVQKTPNVNVHLAYRRRGENASNNDGSDEDENDVIGETTPSNYPQHYDYYKPGVSGVSLHYVKVRPSTIPNFASHDPNATPDPHGAYPSQEPNNQTQQQQQQQQSSTTTSAASKVAQGAAKHLSSFSSSLASKSRLGAGLVGTVVAGKDMAVGLANVVKSKSPMGEVVGNLINSQGGTKDGNSTVATSASAAAGSAAASEHEQQYTQPHHLYDTGREGSFETDIDGNVKHFADAHGEVKLWQSPSGGCDESDAFSPTSKAVGGDYSKRREHFFPDTPMPQCADRGENHAPHHNERIADGIVCKALQELLPLPEGYTEWITPDFCHMLHLPTPELVQRRRYIRRQEQQSQLGGQQQRIGSLRKSILVDRTHAIPSPSPMNRMNTGSTTSIASPSSVGMEAMYLSPSHTPRNSDGVDDVRGSLASPVFLSNSQLAPDPSYLPSLMPSSKGIPPPNDLPEEDSHIYIPIVAIIRQRFGDEERFHEDPAIVNVQLAYLDASGNPPKMVDEDEDEDEEFGRGSNTLYQNGANPDILKKSPWTPSSSEYSVSNNQPSQLAGQPVFMVRHNRPHGFADVPFTAKVLARFPQKNYRGMPFPEEELPLFCYAGGSKLVRDKVRNMGMPKALGFVVKNERGDSIYVSCLTFYEPLTKRRKDELNKLSIRRRHTSLAHRAYHKRTLESTNLFRDDLLIRFDDTITYENKTICLVGRYSYWTEFRRFLTHLHLLSGSSSDIPLERNVSHLLLSVPVPKPGGQCVLVPFSTMKEPMALVMPPLKDLPLVDLSYSRLFAALDVPTVATIVLGFLCLERKVILISTRQSLLLDCCELLKSLLFPFELCAPYVPRLTQPFMSCLEFPGAIFVGVHDNGEAVGLATFVRDSIPEDSIIVDLDNGEINCDGNRYETLKTAYQIIPSESRSLLIKEIENLCDDAGIVPGQEALDFSIDSAIDSSTVPSPSNFGGHQIKQQQHEPLDDRAIRDSFLRFYCSILGGYERFLVVPDADFLTSGIDWFDSSKFLAAASSNHAPFLGSLIETQLFQSFIQRRTEASDIHCVLFDECLAEYHSSKMPYGRLITDPSSHEGDANPHMNYNLLVDECATEPDQLIDDDDSSFIANRSDVYSKSVGTDNDTVASSGYAESDLSLDKDSQYAINASGDIVTIPSTSQLAPHALFMYCVDGNPSFPTTFERRHFLPKEPDTLSTSSEAPPPILTRSEREREDAIRLANTTVSRQGPQKQHRCLWQLAKFMGSQFLGAWLMCIPGQISQSSLSTDEKSKVLLRALGALRTLRSHRRIVADEAAYRALIVACGRCGTDRRVELMKLYGLMRTDGIFPNAVTLGQYTRAIAEGYSNVSVDSSAKVGMQLVLSSDGSSKKERFDLEVLANNSILEESGLKWRSRGNVANTSASAQPAIRFNDTASKEGQSRPPTLCQSKTFDTATTQRSVKTKRAWLPVSCSSSFRPKTDAGDEVEPNKTRLFALWSRAAACKACSYIPLDEEIQSGWDVIYSKLETFRDAVTCPRCSGSIIPLIGYHELTVAELLEPETEKNNEDFDVSGVTQDADPSQDVPPQLQNIIGMGSGSVGQSGFVTYYSPIKLRMVLEELVLEYGEEILDRDRLRKVCHEVLFNLWWYSARFSLPLPLAVSPLPNEEEVEEVVDDDGTTDRKEEAGDAYDCCAFASFDKSVAVHGCRSAAKAIMAAQSLSSKSDRQLREKLFDNPNTDIPLLSFFNLQSYAQSDWDHPDFSEILVALVKACETRDLLPVVECIYQRNQSRKGIMFQGVNNNSLNASFESAGSASFSLGVSTEASSSLVSIELDCYRTVLYLARYQCTTAFHAFFPTTIRACKGYHFWCAQGTAPQPIFDRAFREAAESFGKEKKLVVPIPVVSDVALSFRSVFGHVF